MISMFFVIWMAYSFRHLPFCQRGILTKEEDRGKILKMRHPKPVRLKGRFFDYLIVANLGVVYNQ